MKEKIIDTGKVKLCAQSFGELGQQCILLIMGAMCSMIWWDEEFCKKLASEGRFVIRYDNRDTGRSTSKAKADYDVIDMAGDALSVLDAYGVRQADIVGMSLGGMIAQIMALKYPERVDTITAIASGIFDDRPELGGIDKKITDFHSSFAGADLSDRETLIKYLASGSALLSGSKRAFDAGRAYELTKQDVERAENIFSMFNHSTLGGGEQYYKQIKNITKPVLVIHGDEDPVLPLPHAQALADETVNARIVVLKGAGHEMHRSDWDLIIEEIIKHTEKGGIKK